MADTDVLIKDLPLTETVNDSDDLVTEDSSPTTHRIKASIVKDYINKEQNEELQGIETDFSNVNANIGSLSSQVSDAVNTVSSMQTSVNNLDGRVQANADGISELNSALSGYVPIYSSGSSISSALTYEDGWLTGGNANVAFSIPITSAMGKVSSITVNELLVRQNGSYLVGSADAYASFNGTVDFYQTGLGTRVTLVFPSSIGGTNNDTVGVAIRLTVAF